MSASATTSGDVFSASIDAQERVMAQARARGYAAGWSHGAKAAEARSRKMHAEIEATAQRNNAQAQAALRALGEAISSTNAVSIPAAHDVLDAVLDTALDLAAEILGHEVAMSREPGRDVLRRALHSAADVDITQVRMNPSDLESLTEVDKPPGVSLVADGSIARGDCIVDHPHGHIEHFLSDAVGRVREAISR